jgi:hypothetical protein
MMKKGNKKNTEGVNKEQLERYAMMINGKIIKEFLSINKRGITKMEQTEEWITGELFNEMLEPSRQVYKEMKMIKLIDDVEEYIDTLLETLMILGKIGSKLHKQYKEMPVVENKIYTEDPDDPPVPRIGDELHFNECEYYMTERGLVKFDLQYMLNGIQNMNKRKDPYENIRIALDDSPEIPDNEYIWYFCPFDDDTTTMQNLYYIHWEWINQHNKVSREEISNIISKEEFGASFNDIRRLIQECNLTRDDFIWDVISTRFKMDKDLMFWVMKGKPHRIIVPPSTEHNYERHSELEKLGINRTRKEMKERREIREKLLEAYVKEGEDGEINRTWVKAGRFMNKE